MLTARQAAVRMGVSRKTFYKWEKRGLSALLDGVTDQSIRGDLPILRTTVANALEKRLWEAKREIELAESQDGAEGCTNGIEASRNRRRPDEKKMSASDRRWP